MVDSRKNLFERLKPIWEAVDKIGENDPEFDTRAYLNEMWEEDFTGSVAMGEARDSLGISDADLAEDLETQFKLIAAAYATGEADAIDRVINHVAFIRHMKRQGDYELGRSNDEGPNG